MKEFKPRIGEFLFNLVPTDTKVKSTEEGFVFLSSDEKWDFVKLKGSLDFVNGVLNNSRFKPLEDLDDACYYTYDSGEGMILFEINNGHADSDVEGPSITVKFSERIPSRKCFRDFLDILNRLKDTPINLDFKVFDFARESFVSLNELEVIKRSLK